MVVNFKECTKCGEVKHLEDFSRAPRGKFGRKSNCKACDAARFKTGYVAKDGSARVAWYTRNRGAETKKCTVCGEVKPVSEFGKSNDGKYGPVLRGSCKHCNSERALQWHADNPGRRVSNKRKQLLWDLYRLTPEDYNAMFDRQGGVCAVCGMAARRAHSRDMRLVVDHDHKSGTVRGLLCNRCNRAIGLFADDPLLMRKAISYLLRSKKGAAEQGGQ